MQLSTDTLKEDAELTVSVNVTNTGSRAGKEVVQLYTGELYASITPDVKRLRRFEKIELQPGETRKISFHINKSDLSFIGQNNKPTTETGEFKIETGDLNKMFYYKSSRPSQPLTGKID